MRNKLKLFKKQRKVVVGENTAPVKHQQVTVTYIQMISITVSQNLQQFALRA